MLYIYNYICLERPGESHLGTTPELHWRAAGAGIAPRDGHSAGWWNARAAETTRPQWRIQLRMMRCFEGKIYRKPWFLPLNTSGKLTVCYGKSPFLLGK